VKEGFAFNDGLFTGYDESKKNYVDRSSWTMSSTNKACQGR